jgi:DNA invertase Pin-like site-specific DNA recombinase
MTTAAIYARKSTDEGDKYDEAKSVTRQIDDATAYAESNGWTLLPEHVFSDDAFSGALDESPPGASGHARSHRIATVCHSHCRSE